MLLPQAIPPVRPTRRIPEEAAPLAVKEREREKVILFVDNDLFEFQKKSERVCGLALERN